MALTSEQRRVAQNIIRIGRKRGESAKEIKAAIETGLVEANLTNPRHGDRDSLGWRQERSHYGSAANRLNLKASINRFFDETSKVEGKYRRAGDLAQAVQRSAFPDRYNQNAGRAQQIIRALDNGKGGGGGGSGSTGGSVETVPGVDRSDQRKKLIAQYLLSQSDTPPDPTEDPYGLQQSNSLLTTLVALRQAKDTPEEKVRVRGRTSAGGGGGGTPRGGRSDLKELFYNGPGGVNADNGRRVGKGFVSGHTDHVHAAFSSPKLAVKWGRKAQAMGLRVSEQSRFDKVDPVHTGGSFHYSDRAIDVSGNPRLMAKFSRMIAKAHGV